MLGNEAGELDDTQRLGCVVGCGVECWFGEIDVVGNIDNHNGHSNDVNRPDDLLPFMDYEFHANLGAEKLAYCHRCCN